MKENSEEERHFRKLVNDTIYYCVKNGNKGKHDETCKKDFTRFRARKIKVKGWNWYALTIKDL